MLTFPASVSLCLIPPNSFIVDAMNTYLRTPQLAEPGISGKPLETRCTRQMQALPMLNAEQTKQARVLVPLVITAVSMICEIVGVSKLTDAACASTTMECEDLSDYGWDDDLALSSGCKNAIDAQSILWTAAAILLVANIAWCCFVDTRAPVVAVHYSALINGTSGSAPEPCHQYQPPSGVITGAVETANEDQDVEKVEPKTPAEKIKALKELVAEELISQEEFENRKNAILASI